MEIKLEVPYYSQLDNITDYQGAGWRQCNTSSHAMAIAYLKPDFLIQAQALGYKQPDDYLGFLLHSSGFDTTDHVGMTKVMLDTLGTSSTWSYAIARDDILSQLKKNKPVPMGLAWGNSGHIVCCVGCNDDGLLIHDPYGIRIGDTYDVGADGSYDFYSWGLLESIYWDLGSEAGWGRIF